MSNAKAGEHDHIQPVRLSLTYKSILQGFNSDLRWSIFSGQIWVVHWLLHNAPKRSTRVFDDETLIFSEGTGGTTYKNILNGSKVAVAVVNREILDGYRFLGTPEVLTSGDIYEKSAEMSLKAGMSKPKAVILIHIDEIHSLKPGPLAGKRIG